MTDARCPICKKFKTVTASYCVSCGMAYGAGYAKCNESLRQTEKHLDKCDTERILAIDRVVQLTRIMAVLVPVSVMCVLAAIAGWAR